MNTISTQDKWVVPEHLHQEGYVSIEVPTKDELSERATYLSQSTTKEDWVTYFESPWRGG
jgi:hypothetical protein